MRLNVAFDYDNGFGGIYPAKAVVDYRLLRDSYTCTEFDCDGYKGEELKPNEQQELLDQAEELAYLKVRKFFTYGRRIALMIPPIVLLFILIGAKSLPVYTVVGNCPKSNQSFVAWIEAENPIMAAVDAIKIGEPIEVFEGKQRGLLFKGSCDE